MVLVLVLLIGLSIYDIRLLKKENDKKQMIMYCIFALATLAFGIWYITGTIEHSFCYELFHLLGISDRN
ncbi:MAG: hypothetical protein ACOX3Q_14805 [Clostridia bacterium]|jgi:hypothetical protein